MPTSPWLPEWPRPPPAKGQKILRHDNWKIILIVMCTRLGDYKLSQHLILCTKAHLPIQWPITSNHYFHGSGAISWVECGPRWWARRSCRRSNGDWAEWFGLSDKVNKWFRVGYEINLILIPADRTKTNSAWQLDYADHENVITKTNSALDQKANAIIKLSNGDIHNLIIWWLCKYFFFCMSDLQTWSI